MESDSSAICSDTSIGKLRELLRLESRSHRDTGQCYDTLQKEYDDLLRKYAEAENTIDKLRIDTLRERIQKSKEGDQGVIEISISNNNIWKGLYDDLLCRTSKLQNAVTEFQAHLANHEFAGEELNDIFDRLHNDFENIANAFQSMQALGNKVANPNEKYPEEALIADDLEGNLYRLGLRLEEIQDEIGDQLRNTLKDDGTLAQNQTGTLASNYGFQKTMENTDSRKGYEGECSDTETTKGENILESDDDVDLQLDDWRPLTDDLTEMNFYKNQRGEEFQGLDPKYLSRSLSEPRDLVNLQNNVDITLTPSDFREDLPKEQDEMKNSRQIKIPSSNGDASFGNRRKKTTPRRSPTVPMDRLNLKKSLPPFSKQQNSAVPHPNSLTSPEDSGYLEGSHPSQQGFTPRSPDSPLRNNLRNNGETSPCQEPTVEESAGEQYRQRLDSLRGYILAKRAVNNLPSSVENTDKRSRSFTRGKKNANLNYRNAPRTPPKTRVNTAPKAHASYAAHDPSSSTTESVFSGIVHHGDEETMSNRKFAKDEKPVAKKQDIDTLRDEMRGVRDIVLDLKDSLTSPNRTPSRIPVANRMNGYQKARSLENIRKDDADPSRDPDIKHVDNELSQVHQLQNKQFEMLGKLENKLDDIANKMQTVALNPRHSPLSRDFAQINSNRLRATPRQMHTNGSPHDSCDMSYDQLRCSENVDEVDQRTYDLEECEINDDYDGRLNRRETYSEGGGDRYREPSYDVIGRGNHTHNGQGNRRYCRCKKCQIALGNCVNNLEDCVNTCDNCVNPRDNRVNLRDNRANSRDQCTEMRDDCSDAHDDYRNSCGNGITPYKTENGHGDVRNMHAQVNTDRTKSINTTPFMNHRGGVTSSSYQVDKNKSSHEGVRNTSNRGQRNNVNLNDSLKGYHNKFEEIGEQIDKLTSVMNECKEKEEKKLRDETLQKQKMLVKALEEKLEGLSSKLERNEKKLSSDPIVNGGYVVSCPMCGGVGAHQHGSYFFNGYSIIETQNTKIRNPMNSTRPNIETRYVNSTVNPIDSTQPGPKQGDNLYMHSTPKADFKDDSPEQLSISPNIYHHYHTVYSPPLQETSRQTKGRNAVGYQNGDSSSREVQSEDRVQDSLEKASLAALHMETLSKKMLHGIANDLFNSGPSDF